MQIINPELKPKNLFYTVLLGIQVVIDEWYWLISDALFQFSMRKLYAQLFIETDIDKKQDIKKHVDLRNQAHANFRQVQILRRSYDII